MILQSLISATLILIAVGFLVVEIMTGEVVYWMLGMTFFAAVAFRLLDLENKLSLHGKLLGSKGNK